MQPRSLTTSALKASKATAYGALGPQPAAFMASRTMRTSRPMLNLQPLPRSSQVATQDVFRPLDTNSCLSNSRANSSLLDGLMTEVRKPGFPEPVLSPKQPTDFSKLFAGKRGLQTSQPLQPIDVNDTSSGISLDQGSECSVVPLRHCLPNLAIDSASSGSGGLFARSAKAGLGAPRGKVFEDVASVGAFAASNKENSLPLAADSVVPSLVRARLMKAEYSMHSAPGRDSSPSASQCTGSSQRSCQTTAGDIQQPQQQSRNPPPSRRPPLDMSLKTRLQFTSDRPFDLVESLPSPDAWADAAGSQGQAVTNEVRYRRALQSYAFPDESMDPADVAATIATKVGAARMSRRRQRWEAAFFSLYTKLQNGALDAFYYVAPQCTKRCGFTALFRGTGVGGSTCLTATVSHSTRALRQQLLREGAQFTMPLQPSSCDAETSDGSSQAEVAEELEGTPASALLFAGRMAVGALFQALDRGGGGDGDVGELFEGNCDVPLLLSPLPFVHASLSALQPQVLYSSLRVNAQRLKRQRLPAGTPAPRFKVQLEGMIPPWVVDRLVTALASVQECHISVSLESLRHSSTLNTPPPRPPLKELPDPRSAPCDAKVAGAGNGRSPLQDRSWSDRGYVNSEEALRWQLPPTGSLAGGAAVVTTLEYDSSSRTVQAHLNRQRPSVTTAAPHAWQ